MGGSRPSKRCMRVIVQFFFHLHSIIVQRGGFLLSTSIRFEIVEVHALRFRAFIRFPLSVHQNTHLSALLLEHSIPRPTASTNRAGVSPDAEPAPDRTSLRDPWSSIPPQVPCNDGISYLSGAWAVPCDTPPPLFRLIFYQQVIGYDQINQERATARCRVLRRAHMR